jgi:hypothetical protein
MAVAEETKGEQDVKISYFKAMDLIKSISNNLSEAAEDNKITEAEGLALIEKVCQELGIEFVREERAT